LRCAFENVRALAGVDVATQVIRFNGRGTRQLVMHESKTMAR